MSQSFFSLIERDAHTHVLQMVLGALFMLSAYHLFMFFRNRDRSYLLYSSYSFFSFLAYLPVAEQGFLVTFCEITGLDYDTKTFFTIIFNCIYFFFFAAFLDIKPTNKRWYKIIVFPVATFALLAVVAFVLDKMTGQDILNLYNQIFIVLITLQTALSFYILMKLQNKLKYYIIFGGLILFVSSILGENRVRNHPWINISRETGNIIYFVGLLIENLAFSLALGHKQKVIFDEKVAYHKEAVEALQKNEILKDEVSRENEIRLTVENEKFKYLQQISHLKLTVLQSQMNPHFIFNALNSIKFCILENDNEKAVNYLTKFSKIIRTILAASRMKEFTLAEELHTLQLYVDIENLRFTDIDFQINLAPEIDPDAIKLPPMVLQPFIENAILHGLSHAEEKRIRLDIFEQSDTLKIHISDTGIGREAAMALKTTVDNRQKSMGVNIARGMLKSYFEPHDFSIEYTDLFTFGKPAGTRVEITLPYADF